MEELDTLRPPTGRRDHLSMDLQGVGALAAAGVALLSVPATLLVGRWQTRAALQTAQAAMRQADATYRAALDSVRAQGLNEHEQWRRGIRRDAYAALLQAVLNYKEQASNVFSQGATDPHQAPDAIAASKPLAADMTHKNLVVRLEGPDEVSNAGQALVDAVEGLMQVCRTWANTALTRTLLDECRASHPHEVERIADLGATFRVRNYWHQIGSPDMPNEADEILSELRSLLRTIGLLGRMPLLLTQQEPGAYGDASSALETAIGDFIASTRTALHAEPQPISDPYAPA
ncbi:hypothetical protein FE633_29815 [Streptomyces montanus]|uniref:Uncharacterized protein n=1 Tax=Streptomyces montanus TaxID=2580423 RepID=A0A5R9FFU8_9ACTN|nr:hypothetical protein [Streptomyces montanus]TLS42672.1 hypothetical protein FE633_29815 [Streptomyces montanus]